MGAWSHAIDVTRSDATLREDVVRRVKLALAGEVEVFGDEPVKVRQPLPWSEDVQSNFGWPLGFHRRIDYVNHGRHSDVKRAWELSRLRHCVALAQGAVVLPDDRCTGALSERLRDWRRANPVGWSVNWTCAMEVALRAVNLICIDGILLAGSRTVEPDRREFVASLYQHGWFLTRNLEVSDLNGNHFLANAVGLLWIGRYFAGVGESDSWLSRGRDMLRAAAREQVLGDGLDHEGSLPYHVLVLELFLLGLAAGGHEPEITPPVEAMLVALISFVGPDGRVPDIGDDDGGRIAAFCDAPSGDARRVIALGAAITGHADAAGGTPWPQDALWLAGVSAHGSRRGSGPQRRLFEIGGLVVLGEPPDHIVVDVGPVGFRGRGGHGHLDALSFEATLGEAIVVRDSGTGSYTGDPDLRNRLRRAQAHTAVVIDGLAYARLGDASRLWAIDGDSPPRVKDLQIADAYHRLCATQTIPTAGGAADVERVIAWEPGSLHWTDTVEAPPDSIVRHYVQLPEGCELDGNRVRGPAANYEVTVSSDARLLLEPCMWSSRYGSVRRGTRAIVEYASNGTAHQVTWRIWQR